MHISKLEYIQDKLNKKNILLCEIPTNTIVGASIKLNNKKTIVINRDKIENEKYEFVILAHEYYHCEMETFYNLNTEKTLIRKMEYKTNKAMIQELIPLDKLRYLFEKQYQKWEIAEEFEVPEETIDLSIEIYKNMGEFK